MTEKKKIWNDELVEKIMAQIEPGWTVLAIAVPTRAFRIVVNDLGLIFRVEQLDASRASQGIYEWRTISSHSGDFHFESYTSAIKAMLSNQVKFKEMVKLAEHERRMAHIKAQNAGVA